MADRRDFLRGLAALPLVGGGVQLVGAPTAAAVPVTPELLEAYNEWLDLERSWLLWERFGRTRGADDAENRPHVVWRDGRTGKSWSSNFS